MSDVSIRTLSFPSSSRVRSSLTPAGPYTRVPASQVKAVTESRKMLEIEMEQTLDPEKVAELHKKWKVCQLARPFAFAVASPGARSLRTAGRR